MIIYATFFIIVVLLNAPKNARADIYVEKYASNKKPPKKGGLVPRTGTILFSENQCSKVFQRIVEF